MPPHLHPRSRLTTSLFATTLAVSFLVVGMPHLLPCPAPRSDYADASRLEYRQREKEGSWPDDVDNQVEGHRQQCVSEAQVLRSKPHECPVPKPRGLIGEALGFKKGDTRKKATRPRLETIIADRRDKR